MGLAASLAVWLWDMAALWTLTSASSTMQVFRLEDSCCLFTLQGHSGAITAVYIDQVRCRAAFTSGC